MRSLLRNLAAAACLLSMLVPLATAQDAIERPPAHERTAGPDPTDENFVSGSGGDFDQYLDYTDRPNRANYPFTIDRYYGAFLELDSQGFLLNAQEAIERGFLPEKARLRMRVWDVDNDWSNFNQREVDNVYINGNILLDASNQPLTLTSGNGTWDVWETEFPIEYLRFPSGEGSASQKPTRENLLQVDIDVLLRCGTAGICWAVEVDWLSVEIAGPPRPFLMIHGIYGGPSTWETYRQFFEQDGLPHRVPGFLFMNPIGGLAQNARSIHEEIGGTCTRFGVDRLNLVAHSKGGLDTRMYLRTYGGTRVESLVQLATPNHGSRQADVLYPLALWKPLIYLATMPALQQLTTMWIEYNFNYIYDFFHVHRIETACTEAGSARIDILAGTAYDNYWAVPGESPHDGSVSVYSATLPWRCFPDSYYNEFPFQLECRLNSGEFELTHSGMHDDAAVYQQAVELAIPGFVSRAVGGLRYSGPQYLVTDRDARTDDMDLLAADFRDIPAGETVVSPFTITGTTSLAVDITSNSHDYEVELESPGGIVYRFDSPEYSEASSDLGRFCAFDLESAAPGEWLTRVTSIGGDLGAGITARIRSDLKVEIRNDLDVFSISQPIGIVARLTLSSNPVTDAQVTATLVQAGNEGIVTLVDDGSGDDAVAGDGVYWGQYPGFPQAGGIVCTVQAVSGGNTISDMVTWEIAPESALLDGSFFEVPLDTDGDGLYNSLLIEVGIVVETAGDFMLSGTLKDGDGAAIATATFTTLGTDPWTIGYHLCELMFDGSQISAHGSSGPYSLDDLVLSDLDRAVVVDQLQDAYLTSAYSHQQFQRASFLVLGQFSENPGDLNGNSEYDFLDITVAFDVAFPGNYNYNARLVGPQGEGINWSTNHGYISQGVQNLTFRFSGREINEAGVDGPFRLTNLSIYNSNSFINLNDIYQTNPYSYSQFEGFEIHGTIRDEFTRLALDNATVVLGGATSRNLITGPTGVYHFGGLFSGSYLVHTTRTGYTDSGNMAITLPPDTTLSVYLQRNDSWAGPAIDRTPATLGLHDEAQPTGRAITIAVQLQDDSFPETGNATLFYRYPGQGDYQVLGMEEMASGIWSATIEAASVVLPGIEYFVTATDGAFLSADPLVDPMANPYLITLYTPTADTVDLPGRFDLDDASPNPFNPSTIIRFRVPWTGNVRLVVHNLQGERVAVLVDGLVSAGEHQVMFDAERLGSGVYFYTLTTSQGATTRKMVLLK